MTRALQFFASFLGFLALATPLPGAPRYSISYLGMGRSGFYPNIRMNDNGQFLDANGIFTPGVGTTPVGFQPNSFNNRGQVVGVDPVFNGTIQSYHAQLWTNGNVTDLGPGVAFGISDGGDVVGVSPSDPIG